MKAGSSNFVGVNPKDVGIGNDGIVRFPDEPSLYETSKPRRILIDQLGRRVE